MRKFFSALIMSSVAMSGGAFSNGAPPKLPLGFSNGFPGMRLQQVDTDSYDNKLCHEHTIVSHRDNLTLFEICKQKHGECPEGDKTHLKPVYCSAAYKTDCYLKDLWVLEDPKHDFAKGKDFTYSETNSSVKDGVRAYRTCVYW